MSKKQTTNTFGKGMMLDLHPLTVPNDVLTDALNATTITMNGNEGILQNDMGNGRVESAFLPPGYVPVGIKEYGGIIYVASYNPITNKSQIGSFPSPERNIDQTDDNDLETPLNLLEGKYTRTYKFNEFNKSEYQLGLGGLTNKIEIFGRNKIIRSGDKFGFYFKGQNNNGLLSNYFSFNKDDNERTGNNNGDIYQVGGWDAKNKVYQNNLVTLSVQVLDSNNNLRDLTHQLKRYESNHKPIEFTDESEDDKFNAGYFIDNPLGENDESPVDQERNKSAMNTYNNKLFGKLYLVGQVNVIDHIDVQLVTKSYIDSALKRYIDANDNISGKNILYFYIDYYYNCPNDKLELPKIVLHYNRQNNKIKKADGVFERFPDEEPKRIRVTTEEIDNVSEITNINLEKCDIVVNNQPPHCEFKEVTYNPLQQQNYFTKEFVEQFKTEVIKGIENYATLEETTISTQTQVVNNKTITTTEKEYRYYSPEEPTYDPITNLYRKRYIAYVVLDEDYPIEGVNNTILNYIVIPQMCNIPGEVQDERKTDDEKNGNYLEQSTNKVISQLTHIATEGSIDLSKIGSGECNITTWRYICTDNMVKLNWGLEDYSLDTDVITDMRMDFYDLNSKDPTTISDNNSDWYLTFNQINYNSINTSITFSDDTLKKRHIYLVKLSRKKNGNSESIGWRILITTSIYNDLFMIHNDYCYYKLNSGNEPDNETDLLLKNINIRNTIDLDFNINLIEESKSISTYNNNQFCTINGGNIVSNNGIFKPSLSILDDSGNSYSYIQYTSFETGKTINVNPIISDKYPFEIKEYDELSYTINNTHDIKDNLLYHSNTDTFNIITNHNDTLSYRRDETQSISGTGNSNFILKNKYNFPSEIDFEYNNVKDNFISKHSYMSLSEFINQELPNDIIFPLIGSRVYDSNRCDVYFELFTYNIINEQIDRHLTDPVYFASRINTSRLIKLSDCKNNINSFLQNSGLDDSTFIIIGSPLTFGYNPNPDNTNGINLDQAYNALLNTINSLNDEDEDYATSQVGGSFMLRSDKYPYQNIIYYLHSADNSVTTQDESNTNKRWFDDGQNPFSSYNSDFSKGNWGHKDWFILLWKNKNGEFTVVNKLYSLFSTNKTRNTINNNNNFSVNTYYSENIQSITNINDNTYEPDRFDDIQRWICNKIFGNYSDQIFFKINNRSDSISRYLINMQNAHYNHDYKVSITDNIEITINNISNNFLKYYDNDTKNITINSTGYAFTVNCNNPLLNEFLNFKIQYASSEPITFDEDEYTIKGMDDFISNLSYQSEIEGCIVYGNDIYLTDSNGNTIIDDIYVIENGKVIPSNLATENREFIRSLTVQDNKLLISSYKKGKSPRYAFSINRHPLEQTGRRPLVMTIGNGISYINFDEIDEYSLIF